MNKSVKKWFGSSPSRLVTLAAFVCAAVCLMVGFSSQPRLYAVDYGQYGAVLKQCGLTWTREDLALGDLQYTRPLNTFAYARFSWSSLFTPKAGGSTVYTVALVRLFTAPFGLPFSIDALAFVWAAVLAMAAGIITGALYERLPRLCAVPLIVLCVMYLDGNFCAVFRSLYPQAAAFAFSLLFLAVAIKAWSLPPERRKRWLFPVLIASVLALKSFSSLIVFLPFMAAVDAWVLLSCWKRMKRRYFVAALAALLIFTGWQSGIQLLHSDADYYSNASVYESAFNLLLRKAEDPENILAEWGLDDSYLPDIGKSFYEPEEEYAHFPREGEDAEILFSHVTARSVAGAYLRRPALLLAILNDPALFRNNGFENARNSTLAANEKDFSPTRANGGVLSFLWRLLPYSWTLFFILHVLLSALAVLLAFWKRRPLWALPAVLFSIGSVLYLPYTVILDGYAQSQQYFLYQELLMIGLAAGLLCVLVYAIPLFMVWFTRYMEQPFFYSSHAHRAIGAADAPSGASGLAPRFLCASRGGRLMLTLATGLVCGAVFIAIVLPPGHPACVNNGDFGRMMEQLDIAWSSVEYFDTASQAGRGAVEYYAYTKGPDLMKFTPLKPTYSLYWFKCIVQLLTVPLGLDFSTYLLSVVMGLITLVCVLQIVRDLFPVLGKWSVPAAALLCVLVFNETYLTWYNGLYGESCVLMGLILTLMCAVHLCVMKRGKGPAKCLWLAGLFLSLNILINSKSQMLMAAPGAMALLIVFFVYHRPFRYDLQALHGLVCLLLCAALAFSSVGVYQSDRTADSVSQRHTMWQAYFYGIFMIADDPIAEMERLGVDTAMAPDIGKFVSFDSDADYVYAPLSQEAQTAFYDHVSMFTIVKWYITHPGKLIYMLNHAARESKELYTGFRVYAGQDYSDPNHDEVNGFNLWPGWRGYLAPGSFWGYLIQYAVLLALLIRRIAKKGIGVREKILCVIPLFLIVTGALQYPLSVLGNGFADNQKQLFCFSLCHDFLLAGALVIGARYLWSLTGKLPIEWIKEKIEERLSHTAQRLKERHQEEAQHE